MIEFGSVGEILRVSSENLVDNCDEEQEEYNIQEREAEISERTEKKECEDQFQGQEIIKDNDQTVVEHQDPYEGHYQTQIEGDDEVQVGNDYGSDGSEIKKCEEQHQEQGGVKDNDQTLADGQVEEWDDQDKIGKYDNVDWTYTRQNKKSDQGDFKSCKGREAIKKKKKNTGEPIFCANRFSILEHEDEIEEEEQNDELEQIKRLNSDTKSPKKYKKEKRKEKKKIKKVRVKSVERLQESVLSGTRCKNCFSTHTPYPKFCRWSAARNKKLQTSVNKEKELSDDTNMQLNKHIQRIERKTAKYQSHLNIVKTIFEKSCDATDSQDLCSQTKDSNSFINKDLKLKGGARLKVFDTNEEPLSRILSIIRSLKVIYKFGGHPKCKLPTKTSNSSMCYFCLMRSLVFKSKSSHGRQLIKPVEFLCNLSPVENIKTFEALLNSILGNIAGSLQEFKRLIAHNMVCLDCEKKCDLTDNHIINLDLTMEYKLIEDLLLLKNQKIKNDHICIASNLESNIVLHKDVHVCIFQSSAGMGIHLDRAIKFGGQKWTCSSAVTEAQTLFRENNEWYFTKDKKLYHEEKRILDKVLIAVYEKVDTLVDKSLCPELTYIGNDLERLRGMMAQRKKDRHTDQEARKSI